MDTRDDLTFWTRWLAAMAAGMTVGAALALSLFGMVLTWAFGLRGLDGAAAILATMFLGGALHGAAVGTAQALVLRRYLHEVRTGRWILATTLGAAAAWTLGILGNLLFSRFGPTVESPMLNLALVVLALVLGGAVLGAVVGTAQWTVLGHRLSHAAWWIPANAIAWIAGTGVAWLAASRLSVGLAATPLAIGATVAGIGAGLAAGAITGGTLATLLALRTREA